MTTVGELIEMLSELDPGIPIGTLVVDAGLENTKTSAVRMEFLGLKHTTVVHDDSGKQRSAWILANNALAPDNDHSDLDEFRPELHPYRQVKGGCLLDLPTAASSALLHTHRGRTQRYT